MKLDLIWYFDQAKEIWPNYRDGVRAAMEELERRGHTVRWHLGTDVKIEDDSDFILNWDNSTSQFIGEFHKYPNIRKGLILTTELGLNIESLKNYDVVFAESDYVASLIKPHGVRVITAFGTDTNFFSPHSIKTPKDYKAFYPSTFSPWKRQDVFADLYGDKGLCLGTIQPDGWDILRHTVEKGTNVYIGYLPVERVREFYRNCEMVHITGYEGSGRTVIEALSMDMPVEASPDNQKCQCYLAEFKASGMGAREFAIAYYSAQGYADSLMKGIDG